MEHLQLPVALLQLRQLGQELAAEVDVDQAGGAELGHPRLVWTQAAEGLAEGSTHKEERAEGLTAGFHVCKYMCICQGTVYIMDIYISQDKICLCGA